MKILFTIIFLCYFSIGKLFSQECPIKNDKENITKNRIKSISIVYRSEIELIEDDSTEIAKFVYDKTGNILKEKLFHINDVIHYSEEFEYNYNQNEKLIEKKKTQTDYPRNAEDSSLIDFTNYEPSKEKSTYDYNKEGKLIRENKFINLKEKQPSLATEYKYDNKGNVIQATFKHLKAPQQTSLNNRIETYKYDNDNRLIETVMKWTNSEVGYIVTTNYNPEGSKISETIIHNDGRGYKNIFLYKDGKLESKEFYDVNDTKWNQKIIYKYNNKGLLVSELIKSPTEDDEIKEFEYAENGLLKTEKWIRDNNKEVFRFVTTYEFYQ